MSLSAKQQEFTHCIALLILHAEKLGYRLTVGDAYRDPRLHGGLGIKQGYGRANSNHKVRLAMDFNLFKDGKYLSTTEAHRPLGEYWMTLHPDAEWGGAFDDGNHYSFKHNGHR